MTVTNLEAVHGRIRERAFGAGHHPRFGERLHGALEVHVEKKKKIQVRWFRGLGREVSKIRSIRVFILEMFFYYYFPSIGLLNAYRRRRHDDIARVFRRRWCAQQ